LIRSWRQLAFLAALLLYDVAMLVHVHLDQMGLDEIGSEYDPIIRFFQHWDSRM